MAREAEIREQGWQEFIAGALYRDTAAPWATDPAFAFVLQFPGLRDSVGGRAADALKQTIGLVQGATGVELFAVVQANRPAWGLCLGFGMNVLEPYDLLQTFGLDQVHAYEWIGEQVIEAAQALQALRATEPSLPTRIRLHHGTVGDLTALASGSIRVVYVANVFNPEVPMSAETFTAAVQEITRVLARGGVLISRGSAGMLEAAFRRVARPLLESGLVSVFQKI